MAVSSRISLLTTILFCYLVCTINLVHILSDFLWCLNLFLDVKHLDLSNRYQDSEIVVFLSGVGWGAVGCVLSMLYGFCVIPTCLQRALTGDSGPAFGTDAREVVHFVHTCPTIQAWRGRTLVDVWVKRQNGRLNETATLVSKHCKLQIKECDICMLENGPVSIWNIACHSVHGALRVFLSKRGKWSCFTREL